MLLYCRAAPPPNLGPWPCLALGGEPLANRWRQRSTADRPGAQRPSRGPDIQPKSRSPDPSPVSLSPPRSRSSQGRAPRASAEPPPTSTTPAALWRCAGITLHFCVQVCMHTTHTCVPHAYTLMRAHSTHTCACTHVPTHSCAHTTEHTPPTPSCMYAPTLGSAILQKESLARVCVCA